MLSERFWPGFWIVLRTLGIFVIYATLNSTRSHAATLGLSFLIASSACQVLLNLLSPRDTTSAKGGSSSLMDDDAPQEKRLRKMMSMAAAPLLILCGLWEAINTTVFITAVGKLHPFRASIGEFALYFIISPSGPGDTKRKVVCAVVGIVLLTWANNMDASSGQVATTATGTSDDIADSLHNVATTYRNLGDFSLALPLFKESLAIRAGHFPADHPAVLFSKCNIATCCSSLGEWDKALPLFLHSTLCWVEKKSRHT